MILFQPSAYDYPARWHSACVQQAHLDTWCTDCALLHKVDDGHPVALAWCSDLGLDLSLQAWCEAGSGDLPLDSQTEAGSQLGDWLGQTSESQPHAMPGLHAASMSLRAVVPGLDPVQEASF